MRPYLFLDAGSTLVFPDHRPIRQVLLDHGYDVSTQQIERGFAEAVHDYDRRLAHGISNWNAGSFFGWSLQRAGVLEQDVEVMVRRLEAKDATHSLWAFTYPWVGDALALLHASGYRMSVISNADGRAKQALSELGLAPYLEAVFDSHLVGFAKPDPCLFEHAMSELKLQPADCLHVGDMYYMDVLGANRAGIAAIQVDRHGLYRGWPGVRITTIACLRELLAHRPDLSSEEFFPLRERGSPRWLTAPPP